MYWMKYERNMKSQLTESTKMKHVKLKGMCIIFVNTQKKPSSVPHLQTSFKCTHMVGIKLII